MPLSVKILVVPAAIFSSKSFVLTIYLIFNFFRSSGECEDIYNRYCHIRASLGSKTMLELVSTDYVEVTLSPEDLTSPSVFSEDMSALYSGNLLLPSQEC